MSLDPVKIPQNVYVEDRIIGPITLRQIFLTLGGGGVSYALYAIMKQTGRLSLMTGILSWTPLLIMAAFAFIKINGISLFKFLLLMAEKSEKPTARYWQPRQGISMSPKSFVPMHTKEKNSFSHTQEEYDEIRELSSVLDSGPISPKAKTKAKENGSNLPVNKERVSVEASSESKVDTVSVASEKKPTVSKGTVQDIVPPSK